MKLKKVCSSSDFKKKNKSPNLRRSQVSRNTQRDSQEFREGLTPRTFGKRKGVSFATPDMLKNGHSPKSQLIMDEFSDNKKRLGQGAGLKIALVPRGEYKKHIKNRG